MLCSSFAFLKPHFVDEFRKFASFWSLLSVKALISELADAMADEGIVLERGPRGSGSFLSSFAKQK